MIKNDSASSTRLRKSMIILATTMVVIFIIFTYTKFTYNANYRYGISLQSKANCELYCSKSGRTLEENCHWYFHNYTPSSWESIWYNNIEVLQRSVCETLANMDNVNKSILAMRRLIELQKFRRNQTDEKRDAKDELLSKMYYRQRCIDPRTDVYSDVAEVSQLIEPLIGLLRDPLTVCPRMDESRVPSSLYDGAILLSRRNLLLSVSAPYYISPLMQEHPTISTWKKISNDFSSNISPWMYQRSKINPSERTLQKNEKRIILFDLGSSYFGSQKDDISETSTLWFYEYYKRLGLKFDRIIAFEAASLDPKKAWEQLPDDAFPVYTLINTGCTVNGIFNPWMTLRRLVKSHDHVVVKIDIDSFDIENVLIDQVLNDSSIHSLIDELFFEHHVSVKEMLAYWRPPPGSLRDSYILFTKLRQLGIRMHSWP